MSSPKESGKSAEDLFGNSSLDHALLESLFYTEMMHMNDDSNVLSNQLLSSLTADGAVVPAHEEPLPHHHLPSETPSSSVDPHAVAVEQDLLSHFGVESQPTENIDNERKVPARPATTAASTTSAIPRLQLASPGARVSSLTASLVPELVVPPIGHAPAAGPSRQQPLLHTPAHTLHTSGAASVPSAAPDASMVPAPPSANLPAEEEKRSKLVNQFATLASRLGITLPTNVLQSLSQVAHVNPTPIAATAPPTVQQLAATAEAAVASVGRKRPRSESPPQATQQVTQPTQSTVAVAAAAAKRRKKPRLVECEHKLAALKAENAMLKRHLANLSAQSHQLEQDRQAQEQRMRQMAAAGSTEEELEQAIQTFQDMYSDYGRRRHDELTFHLDQLVRLANPTNFTKMGLWTMGQQSKNNRNPIASILQKELGITPQQGKKILEQREKIRNVCDNMKEVRVDGHGVSLFVSCRVSWIVDGYVNPKLWLRSSSPCHFVFFWPHRRFVCWDLSKLFAHKRLKSFTIA